MGCLRQVVVLPGGLGPDADGLQVGCRLLEAKPLAQADADRQDRRVLQGGKDLLRRHRPVELIRAGLEGVRLAGRDGRVLEDDGLADEPRVGQVGGDDGRRRARVDHEWDGRRVVADRLGQLAAQGTGHEVGDEAHAQGLGVRLREADRPVREGGTKHDHAGGHDEDGQGGDRDDRAKPHGAAAAIRAGRRRSTDAALGTDGAALRTEWPRLCPRRSRAAHARARRAPLGSEGLTGAPRAVRRARPGG